MQKTTTEEEVNYSALLPDYLVQCTILQEGCQLQPPQEDGPPDCPPLLSLPSVQGQSQRNDFTVILPTMANHTNHNQEKDGTSAQLDSPPLQGLPSSVLGQSLRNDVTVSLSQLFQITTGENWRKERRKNCLVRQARFLDCINCSSCKSHEVLSTRQFFLDFLIACVWSHGRS